ncbi:hypothetical protein TNCV_2535881 [Trichonephila clavipes]|nr:hypothetical protein TNCV_2535881 [Trichonephila clavipes]
MNPLSFRHLVYDVGSQRTPLARISSNFHLEQFFQLTGKKLFGAVVMATRRSPQNVLAVYQSIAIDLMPTTDQEDLGPNEIGDLIEEVFQACQVRSVKKISDDDNVGRDQIFFYGKHILKIVQSSKNVVDADSDDENETNSVAPVPTSSEIRNIMKRFQECDEEYVETWMACDAEDYGFQMLNDEEIVTSFQEETDTVDHETAEDEDNNERRKGSSTADAFSTLETAMERCEQQSECCPTQLLLLKKIRELAAKKQRCTNRKNK